MVTANKRAGAGPLERYERCREAARKTAAQVRPGGDEEWTGAAAKGGLCVLVCLRLWTRAACNP